MFDLRLVEVVFRADLASGSASSRRAPRLDGGLLGDFVGLA